MTRDEATAERENGAGVPPARHPPPWWALVLDVTALALLGVALWVALTDGIVTRVLGVRVTIKSIVRPLGVALALIVVRHAIVASPSIVDTIRRGFSRLSHAVRRAWPAVAELLPVFISTRFAVLLVGLLAVLTIGYAPGKPPYRVSESELGNLPMRWDAGWYMSIALDGYKWEQNPTGELNVAFFPAYPMLIRAAGLFRLTQDSADVAMWVAVGVSLLAFFAALLYLQRLARSLTDDDTARHGLMFLSAYPFALFYSAAYTESLFLLGVLAAFYHQARRQPGRTAAWGLLVGLTRPNGTLLSASLGLMALGGLWHWRMSERGTRGTLGRAVLASVPGLAAASAPLAGMLIYSAVVWYQTGDPFQWVEIQRIGWGKSAADFSLFWEQVKPVLELGPWGYFERWPLEVLNLAATLLALVSIWPVTVRLGAPYGLFVALTTLFPLANGGLLSMGRYTSVLFPMFIWLGMVVPRRARAPVVFVFAALQAVAAALFYTWHWLI